VATGQLKLAATIKGRRHGASPYDGRGFGGHRRGDWFVAVFVLVASNVFVLGARRLANVKRGEASASEAVADWAGG
jgi:hypothetical protein